jgi:hypothetical protein
VKNKKKQKEEMTKAEMKDPAAGRNTFLLSAFRISAF